MVIEAGGGLQDTLPIQSNQEYVRLHSYHTRLVIHLGDEGDESQMGIGGHWKDCSGGVTQSPTMAAWTNTG